MVDLKSWLDVAIPHQDIADGSFDESLFAADLGLVARDRGPADLACRPGIIAHVIIELVPPDTGRAFEAMRELRPALASRESFVQQVDERQRPDGYRLIGSTPDDDGPALAVASFRVGENLAWGGHLYVDDLSTVPTARKQGHARQLLEWLNAEAARLGIRQVHLDSGVGAERAAAHRLYFTSGYRISSYHFARQG